MWQKDLLDDSTPWEDLKIHIYQACNECIAERGTSITNIQRGSKLQVRAISRTDCCRTQGKMRGAQNYRGEVMLISYQKPRGNNYNNNEQVSGGSQGGLILLELWS